MDFLTHERDDDRTPMVICIDEPEDRQVLVRALERIVDARVVSLDIIDRVSDYYAELARIPQISLVQARSMTSEMSRMIKRVERALMSANRVAEPFARYSSDSRGMARVSAPVGIGVDWASPRERRADSRGPPEVQAARMAKAVERRRARARKRLRLLDRSQP